MHGLPLLAGATTYNRRMDLTSRGDMTPLSDSDPLDTASRSLAVAIRRQCLVMTTHAQSSHIASALSAADILAVLYSTVLRIKPSLPTWDERDRFVMSKGHASSALYACLAGIGMIDEALLAGFGEDDTPLAGHVTAGETPGIECSAGSLGHGLSQALGMAKALRMQERTSRVFCLMSDGECQEGTTWEAAILAGQWALSNVSVVIDANGMQGLGHVSEIANLEPLLDKWVAFGWDAAEVDGHDHQALAQALTRNVFDKPQVTVARTIKGKGVSFMESQLEWHYRSLSPDRLTDALSEVESG
jgi:transketolase